MTVSGFTAGSYTYTCHFGSGGDANFPVSISSDPQTFDNGHTCYDTIPGDTMQVIVDGVASNTVTVPGGGGGQQPAPAAASITASKGGHYGCGNCYALNIAVHNFPSGTYTYTCHDNSGPGGSDTGYYSHAVTVTDPNQGTWPGVFCDDNAPYVAYLTMAGVTSNSVQF
jgi:hypothetical protein